MEEKWILAALFFALIVAAFFGGGLLSPDDGPAPDPGNVSRSDSVIYMAYSETCPHCHTLMEYVRSKQANVTIAATTRGVLFTPVLQEHNVSWDFGVPLMFAVVDGRLVGLQGFPAESQEQDGYFMGKEFERGLCERQGGTPHLPEGEYRFCELPNGLFLGNQHSADYIVNVCETNKCDALDIQP